VADQDLVLDALWDLVWAGEVTNDTYAPVRALASRSRGGRGGRGGRRGGGGGGRARPGRLTRMGPPTAQGRWSLTSATRARPPDDTRRATAIAEQLLERHGVLTRESMRAESVPGGFSTVYPVLRAAEEAGRVRRAYVVAGLGAAQFAAPGAIDRLRDRRERTVGPAADGGGEPRSVVRLAATDPAQPYGAALPWPPTEGRPARAAGAFVVLVDGSPAAFLERGGRRLTTFGDPAEAGVWLPSLVELVHTGRLRKLEIVSVDGVPIHEAQPWPATLEAAGFSPGYRGLIVRGGPSGRTR
jgi:ATP-dependent helicase Lhr and Lhr-like helicase